MPSSILSPLVQVPVERLAEARPTFLISSLQEIQGLMGLPHEDRQVFRSAH